MNRYQFEILKFIENGYNNDYSFKQIADCIKISQKKFNEELKNLMNKKYVEVVNGILKVTLHGLAALEPYRVKRAVIMGARFGSRMMPATKNCPKPMVKVNGKRIIETQLDALINVGIKDITIVRGYQKEKYNELLIKYPFLKFIVSVKFS